MTVAAVVLAGGTGTRLYPASRGDRPKQFLALDGDRSLLARTVDRLGFADETYVLTAPEYADQVHDHAPEAAVLTEPEPKDTGPALAYATARIDAALDDAVVLAVPSDHRVGEGFGAAADRAAEVATHTEGLVAMGVEPTRPATGYGYIEPAEDAEDATDGNAEDATGDYAPVARFHEKPDAETAREYVDRGLYWNAGVFAWTPEAFLREARESPLAPVVDAVEAGDPEAGFGAVDPISVDYAVMERTDDAYVLPVDFEWDDLGTWDAVARVVGDGETDAGDGNAVLGDALAIDATDTLLVGEDAHVSAVGVSGLVVVAVEDRVLVVPREAAGRVREVVARLREDGRF